MTRRNYLGVGRWFYSPTLVVERINLCSGSARIRGYTNLDIAANADVVIDLERQLLPFADESAAVIVCISAINYFEPARAARIIKDVHRVLKPGGVARFGVQDLEVLASAYVRRDCAFWFQKLDDGCDRFPGRTFAEKFNEFCYGFRSHRGKHCRSLYDFETLRLLFEEAGFKTIERRNYRESRIAEVALIDNRPEQMFFLEALK